jgi:hypothetical protein
VSNVWLDGPPDTVLAALGDSGDSNRGYVYVLASSDSLVRIGSCSNPKPVLSRVLRQAGVESTAALLRCVLSRPHPQQWQSEFHLHNRFAAQRRFGDVFGVSIDEVVRELNELQLIPAS